MVAPALAGVLGLGEQPGRSAEETVLAWLAERAALLVLDNCEHLVDAVVVLIERLLTACPQVTVLATSRARLLVPYERVFSVPGLAAGLDDQLTCWPAGGGSTTGTGPCAPRWTGATRCCPPPNGRSCAAPRFSRARFDLA